MSNTNTSDEDKLGIGVRATLFIYPDMREVLSYENKLYHSESALQELREENKGVHKHIDEWIKRYRNLKEEYEKNDRLLDDYAKEFKIAERENESLQAKVERLEKMINGFVSDYKSCVSSREVDEKICKRVSMYKDLTQNTETNE